MDSGPTRPDRDRRKSHRADKPYGRAPPRPTLRRSASIVDSLKSIVAKPFSWFTTGSAEQPQVPSSASSSSPATALPVVVNGNHKRRASRSESSEPQPTPKKLRRISPQSSLSGTSTSKKELRATASLPHFVSQSTVLRPPRASFLPPLPRTSTPVRQSSVEPTRFASPAVRASPSVGSTVFTHRAGSLTPQASFENATDKTAFGLRYRSPFVVPRPSPGPSSALGLVGSRSLSRQPSILSDRGGPSVLALPKPRLTLAADDAASERADSESPTRRHFSPAASPTRKLSDSVGSQLIPPFQSATLRRAGSVPFPTGEASFDRLHKPFTPFERSSTMDSSIDSLSQAQRTISHVAARSTSPEKMSNDRIFQALEEALPWSQSRKLRHEQRAKIKVPTPSTSSRLAARAGRMVKPYGRVGDKDAVEDVEMDEADKASKDGRLLEGLIEKREAGKKAAEAEVKDDGAASSMATDPSGSSSAEPAKPPVKSPVPLSSILPPLSSIIEVAAESSEPLPFALVPTTASVAPANDAPSQSQSFLRERRTRTSAVHTSVPPRRPGSAQDRRPNRFAMDEDEEGAEDADGEDAELQSWASKNAIALEIPLNWSFGGAKSVPIKSDTDTSQTEPVIVKEDSHSTPKPSPFPRAVPSAFSLPAAQSGTQPSFTPPSAFSISKDVSPAGAPEETAGVTQNPGSFGATSAFASFPSAGSEEGAPKKDATPSFLSPSAPSASPAASALFAGFASKSSVPGPSPFAGVGVTVPAVTPTSNPIGTAPASSSPFGGANPFGNAASKSSPFGSSSLFGGVSGQPASSADTKEPAPAVSDFVKPANAFAPGDASPSVSAFSAAPKPSASDGAKADSIAKPFAFGMPSAAPADAAKEKPLLFGGSFAGTAPGSSGPASAFSSSLGTKEQSPANGKPDAPASSAFRLPSLASAPVASSTADTAKSPPAASSNPFAWPPSAKVTENAGEAGLGKTNGSPTALDAGKDAKPSPFSFTKPSPSSTLGSAPNASSAATTTAAAATPTSMFGAAGLATGSGSSPADSSNSSVQPFKFGTPASASATEASKTQDAAPKSLFSFGSPASTPAEIKSPPAQPAFSFGQSSLGAPSVATPAVSERPRTPPPMSSDNTRETSPVQNVTNAPAVPNGTSPFAFGGQTPSFTFGSSQPASSFGAPSATVPSFSFSGSRPGTPSSPFPQSASFNFASAAPASPFGAPSALPSSSSFAFGSAPQQPPGTPTSAAAPGFSFSFSPVASPVLSPTTLSGAQSAPFVFGATASDAGASAPGTPTTPGRRPMRSLPTRKKR